MIAGKVVRRPLSPLQLTHVSASGITIAGSSMPDSHASTISSSDREVAGIRICQEKDLTISSGPTSDGWLIVHASEVYEKELNLPSLGGPAMRE